MSEPRISRQIDRFSGDRLIVLILLLLGFAVAAGTWLASYPEHNPWAPLNLDDPLGWATANKLAALRNDTAECRAVLARSNVTFTVLPGAGEGACLREDRTRLDDLPLSPSPPPTTCPVAVGMELWHRQALRPAARDLLQSDIQAIEHFGAFSCRRLYGRDEGSYSEHATGNAIDIAGFVLDDGTRISVLEDWDDDGAKGRFLRQVRNSACAVFGTVLSPDYNAAHADHFHLDQSPRWRGVCR